MRNRIRRAVVVGVLGTAVAGCSSQSINPASGGGGTGAGGSSTGGTTSDAGPDVACAPGTITVTSSTYAANCGKPTPLKGIAAACDGQENCTYPVIFSQDPGFDPNPGCPKDLTVKYSCSAGDDRVAYVPAEAYAVTLDCGCGDAGGGTGGADGAAGAAGSGPCDTIEVQAAVYAANCNAPTSMPTIAAECDGKHNCTYVVDTVNKDPKGDPAPGCWKDLSVDYNCMGDGGVAASKNASATMVHDGTQLVLACCPP